MIFTYIVITKALKTLEIFKLRFYFLNSIFVLLEVKKNIFKATFILILANKEI